MEVLIYDSDSNKALLAFITSLAVHILLAFYFSYLASLEPVSKQDTPMEIVFTEPVSKKNMFVQSNPQQPKKDIKVKKPVKFKSNQTQRTELETFKKPLLQAPMQASFSSGGNGGKKKQNKPKKQMKTAQEGWRQSTKDRKPLELPGFGSTSSRPMIPAYVQQQMPPGVRLGNITVLNTDQHRFYSFNQRLLSRFVPLWGSRVRSALYKWLKKNNAPSISKTWVTNVEVIMNEQGEILDVQPFRLSGLWDIDQASLQSFKDVETVPNPPAEMIDENGYIHLQFQTEVLWIPQPGVRFHGGGPAN